MGRVEQQSDDPRVADRRRSGRCTTHGAAHQTYRARRLGSRQPVDDRFDVQPLLDTEGDRSFTTAAPMTQVERHDIEPVMQRSGVTQYVALVAVPAMDEDDGRACRAMPLRGGDVPASDRHSVVGHYLTAGARSLPGTVVQIRVRGNEGGIVRDVLVDGLVGPAEPHIRCAAQLSGGGVDKQFRADGADVRRVASERDAEQPQDDSG